MPLPGCNFTTLTKIFYLGQHQAIYEAHFHHHYHFDHPFVAQHHFYPGIMDKEYGAAAAGPGEA
jgi:hypothetical protein